MTKERCLVLGANGFIGSHLVDELIEKGYAVRALDRFLNAEPQFKPDPDIEVIKGDIYDSKTLQDCLRDIDYVFHCFSATTPFSSDNDPVTDVERNLLPSIEIFKRCAEQGVKKVIFVSSGGAVYGQVSEDGAVTEEDAPLPVSPYGIIKLAIEGYMAYFKRKAGLDYVVYRLSNPYGPRQVLNNNQGVIPAFIGRIQAGESLQVYGDGSSTRDYIYIGDATKMIADSFARQTKHNLYNIGSGRQTSLTDIIENLKAIFQRDLDVEYLEAPKTFLKTANISTKRFESEFGVHDLTDLEAGLRHTIEAN